MRRPVLFAATLTAGLVMILLDVPLLILIAGTFLAGFLVLVATGALPLSGILPSRRQTGKEKTSTEKASAGDAPAGRLSGFRSTAHSVHLQLKTFAASVRATLSLVGAPDYEKKAQMDALDRMLDGMIEDHPTEPQPSASAGSAINPFTSLEGLDDAALESLEIDGDTPHAAEKPAPEPISMLSEDDARAVSEILQAHGDEIDEEFDEIPDTGLLAGALDELDDIELDSVEIDVEAEATGTDTEGEPGSAGDVPDEQEIDGPGQEEEELQERDNLDMVTFASGGLADDSLMAELRSDVRKRSVEIDTSLVRELQGAKISAADLAAEMEEVLRLIKPEPK
ncbi:hypothetical protein ASZ90_011139 [hydrocarbon metagenome]|uniref:Uncharacterized protein n=1 Tax=hydrocarbon metagenome TaxID=938273 RepID=A0A0W8FE36_9ZZZZ